jgi:uncharacterized protein YhjY with autotransporter beta-barrel domain
VFLRLAQVVASKKQLRGTELTESNRISQFSRDSHSKAQQLGRNLSLLMRSSSLATCMALGGFAASGHALAQPLDWDAGNNAGNGGVEGGGGIWDGATSNWTGDSGASNIKWIGGSVANFGGAGGAVTVTGVQVIDGMVFTGSNYTVSAANAASTLKLFDGSANLTVSNAGDTATVSAVITGLGGVAVNGPGTLVLAGANTYSGATTINGGGILLNNGAIAGAVAVNTGVLINSGTIAGSVANKWAIVSTGALNGGLTNSGSSTADISGVVAGPILNQGSSALKITGDLDVSNNTLRNIDTATVVVEAGAVTGITTLTNSSTAAKGVEIKTGASLQAVNVVNGPNATIANQGTLTATSGIQNNGTVSNGDGGIINGAVTNAGKLLNSNLGTINGAIANTGTLTSTGTINGNLTNSGSGSAAITGVMNGDILNQGSAALKISGNLALNNNTLRNIDTATVVVEAGAVTGISTLTNSSTAATGVEIKTGASLQAVNVVNGPNATIANQGTLTATSGIQNNGTVSNGDGGIINGAVTNAGKLLNSSLGTINGAIANTGTAVSAGTLNGSFTNSVAGRADIKGVLNGVILNQDSAALKISGNLAVNNSALTNSGTATVSVTAGAVTGISTLDNSSTAARGVEIASGASLAAANVVNGLGATLANDGTLSAATGIQNNGTVSNGDGGIINGAVSNAGKLLNSSLGTINGAIANTGTAVSAGALNGSFTNSALGRADIKGVLNGAILNQDGAALKISGNLAVNNQTLTNNGTATVNVTAGAVTGITTLSNSSTAARGVEIASGASVLATDILNEAGAALVNSGTLSATNDFKNSGTLYSTGALNGNLINGGAGAAILSGALSGTFSNQDSSTLTVIGALTGVTTLTNSSAAIKGVEIKTGASLSAASVLNNAKAAFVNSGTLTSANIIQNSGALVSTGTINGGLANSGAGTASLSGALNGAIVNLGASALTVTGALTGVTALTNSSASAAGVSIASGASLTAVSIDNAAGASIVNGGVINSVIANLGSLANNGTVNGGLTVGVGGTLSGTGNLTSLVLNGGSLLATGAQTVAGSTTQNSGEVLGRIIGSGAGQYSMNGGILSGSVTKYGSFVQTGGALAAGSNITVDAFGSTGGTDAGATINAHVRAAAAGGQILALGAAQSNISNDAAGISFVSDAVTPLGSAGAAAVTTRTMAAGATDIIVNNGISGLSGINAAALGAGEINIKTIGAIKTASTAISMQTAGGAGSAHIFGGIDVSGPDAALAGAGNATFNIGSLVEVKAASLLNSISGQTTLNNSGAINAQSLSAGGGGNVVFNNQTSGIVTLGGLSLSSFSGASDSFNNSGALNVSGNVTLAGLENFTSQDSGSISLGNGAGGDRLTLGGNLDLAASKIFMDVDLSKPFDDSRKDMIKIGGTLSGSGAVFNFTNIGVGNLPAFFEDLIIIDAEGVADKSTFEVSGLANAGLFDYGLFAKDGNLNLRSQVKADVAGGIVSNFITAQNTVSNAFFKPTSSFVSTPLNPEPNQFGFAPWFRTSGGLSRVGSEGVAIPESRAPQSVFSKVSVGYGGYQFGLDGGLFNLGDKGGNVHVGLTAGQIFGTASQLNYNNKTGMSDTFAGGYAIYSKGPFFVDAQLRGEFIDYTVNVDDFLFKIDNSKVKAKRFSAGISGGYNFKLNDWSIVPAAGYTYALTKTGDLQIQPNTLLQQSASTVAFGDSQAHVVFGGLSVARSYLLFDDRVRLSPFMSLTAYHDFGQENQAQLTIMTAPKTIIDVSSKSGSTYGEVSLGANFLALTPKFGGTERLLTGNLRGDVQFGKDRLAGSLNMQLRLQF